MKRLFIYYVVDPLPKLDVDDRRMFRPDSHWQEDHISGLARYANLKGIPYPAPFVYHSEVGKSRR